MYTQYAHNKLQIYIYIYKRNIQTICSQCIYIYIYIYIYIPYTPNIQKILPNIYITTIYIYIYIYIYIHINIFIYIYIYVCIQDAPMSIKYTLNIDKI